MLMNYAENSNASKRADRMAVAGLVLSLMGAVTLVTSPLQGAALLLSLCAGKTQKMRGLRRTGILISVVSLVLSLCFWSVLACNFEMVFSFLTKVFNEFYY